MVLLGFSLLLQLLLLQCYLSTTHIGPRDHLQRAPRGCHCLQGKHSSLSGGLEGSLRPALVCLLSLTSLRGCTRPWLRTSPVVTLPRSVRPLCSHGLFLLLGVVSPLSCTYTAPASPRALLSQTPSPVSPLGLTRRACSCLCNSLSHAVVQ